MQFLELLELAVGKSGDLNFNYLHQLLLGIVNHLDISTTIVRIEDSSLNGASPLSNIILSRGNSVSVCSPHKPLQLKVPLTKNGSEHKFSTQDSRGVSMDGTEDDGYVTQLENHHTDLEDDVFSDSQGETLQFKSNSGVSEQNGTFTKDSSHDRLSTRVQQDDDRSLSKAGDMWNTLNFDRRLEATEAAIEGLSHFFDEMNAQLDEVKSNFEDENWSALTKNSALSSKVLSLEKEVDLITNDVRELTSRIENCPSNADFEKFSVQVKLMLSENLTIFAKAMEEPKIKNTSKTIPANNNYSMYDDFKPMVKEGDLSGEVENSTTHLDNENISLTSESTDNVKKRLSRSDTRSINSIAAIVKKEFASMREKNVSLVLSHEAAQKLLGGMSKSIANMQRSTSGFSTQIEDLTASHQSISSTVQDLSRKLIICSDAIEWLKESELGGLAKLQDSVSEVQEQYRSIDQRMDNLTFETEQNHLLFKELQNKVEELEVVKLNESDVLNLIEGNAADPQSICTQERLNKCIKDIDERLQNMARDISRAETKHRNNFQSLRHLTEGKFDREEATKLRAHIEALINSLRIEDVVDDSRKRVVGNCICISCDRPVPTPSEENSSTLPYLRALPPSKTSRPVTMRQSSNDAKECTDARKKVEKELLQMCGASHLNEISDEMFNKRSCGGGHTSNNLRTKPTVPHQQEIANSRSIVGKDGYIYKGQLRQRQVSTELPDILKESNNRKKYTDAYE